MTAGPDRPGRAHRPAPTMRDLALVVMPLAVGAVLSFLADAGRLPDPMLYVRADLAATLALAGLAGSLLAALWLAWRRERAASQRELQQARAQVEEDRRRFLRRLDHELKNPLTAIRAGLANLRAAPEAGSEPLASVEAQAIRLSHLAADLRTLAELETAELERAPVDIQQLLQEALAAAQERPEATGRRLVLSLPRAPWPLPAIPGNHDLLFLAIHNVLDNALKFSRPGDMVEVRAIEDGTSVTIEIADTGPGIPEDELPHVWEELYRAQAARSTAGSGLGLALVRTIVERHSGRASLRSRPGQGTVVTLRLPAR